MADKETPVPTADSPQEAGASVGGDPMALAHALGEELEATKRKADDHWNQFLRARAELENTRRRAERDVEQAHKFALERFALELLGVRDSLELGALAAREPGADVERLREGTDLTLRLLAQAMEKFAIVQVDPQGQRFDPARHEAMTAQESAEVEPNTVLQVIQKGYVLNDRLLRPARVIVSKAGPKPPEGPRIDETA